MTASVIEAQAAALALVARVEEVEVALDEALGRVLREEVRAERDVPEEATSMMDGFAVRAADLRGGRALLVVEESAAGRPSRRPLRAGEAAPISTGALLPPDADAVVPVEETARTGPHVLARIGLEAGAFVREPGAELHRGELVLAAGGAIDAAAMALLAAQGRARVRVARAPSVAILSTGAEVRAVGAVRGAGDVYDANGPALAALVTQAGGVPRRGPIVADELAAVVAAISAARAADLIVLSGAVSAGAHDHARAALEQLGADVVLQRVAMKPGKPLTLARLGTTPIVGLPGNPVSAQVGFRLFVRPMIRALLGARPHDDAIAVEVRLAEPFEIETDRPTYLRATVRARQSMLVATIAARQHSAAAISTRDANAFVIVPPGRHAFAAEALLPALLLGPLAGGDADEADQPSTIS